MIESGFIHDPEHSYNDPETNDPETEGLSFEKIQDRVRFAENLKSIFVYNADESVNIDKTLQERNRLIDQYDLRDTGQYAKNFEIGNDEQGLPILIHR